MKKLFPTILLFSLFFQSAIFSQQLRKNIISVTSGYVVGNNSSQANNSSQYLLWGDYFSSNLDEISAVYKNFNLNESDFNYKEVFFAIKGLVNLFPLYLTGSIARLNGKYKNEFGNYNVTGNLFSGEGIYYYNLFFLSLGGKYISYNSYGNSEKIVAGFGEVKWRPSLFFTASIGTQIMKSNADSLYKSVSLDLFYKPFRFVNFSLMGFVGERKYNFDRKYLISYNLPQKETGAYSSYIRIDPIKQIGFILNYEKHFYDNFSVEYYSVSVKLNLQIN